MVIVCWRFVVVFLPATARRASAADCLMHPWLASLGPVLQHPLPPTGHPLSFVPPPHYPAAAVVRGHGFTVADGDGHGSQGYDVDEFQDVEDETDPMVIRRRQIAALKAGVDNAFKSAKLPGLQAAQPPPAPPKTTAQPGLRPVGSRGVGVDNGVWDVDDSFDEMERSGGGQLNESGWSEDLAPPAVSRDDCVEIATSMFGEGALLPFDQVGGTAVTFRVGTVALLCAALPQVVTMCVCPQATAMSTAQALLPNDELPTQEHLAEMMYRASVQQGMSKLDVLIQLLPQLYGDANEGRDNDEGEYPYSDGEVDEHTRRLHQYGGDGYDCAGSDDEVGSDVDDEDEDDDDDADGPATHDGNGMKLGQAQLSQGLDDSDLDSSPPQEPRQSPLTYARLQPCRSGV